MKINSLEKLGIWTKDPRIEKARKIILPLIKKRVKNNPIFDELDLEHQILFRMTTFPVKDAFNHIEDIFEEQFTIICKRMLAVKIPPEDLFCFGYPRENHNWKLKWESNKKELYAINKKERRKVLFKEVSKEAAKEIMDNYHYIHCSRSTNGWAFGFYLEGFKYPFAVEEIEPCTQSHNYKKAILMLNDIDYRTCVELTRFYSVPNSPRNVISISDKLVGRILKEKGFEWMMTATMPIFSKTKSTTIAGGIDKPIFCKKCEFEFFRRDDNCWELCVSRRKMENHLTIKSVWNLHPVFEFIKPLKKQRVGDIPLIYIEK